MSDFEFSECSSLSEELDAFITKFLIIIILLICIDKRRLNIKIFSYSDDFPS